MHLVILAQNVHLEGMPYNVLAVTLKKAKSVGLKLKILLMMSPKILQTLNPL